MRHGKLSLVVLLQAIQHMRAKWEKPLGNAELTGILFYCCLRLGRSGFTFCHCLENFSLCLFPTVLYYFDRVFSVTVERKGRFKRLWCHVCGKKIWDLQQSKITQRKVNLVQVVMSLECISWDIYHRFFGWEVAKIFWKRDLHSCSTLAPLPAPHFQKFECAQQLAKRRPTISKSMQWLQQTQVAGRQVAGRQVQVYHQ